MHERKILFRYLGEMLAAFILYFLVLVAVHRYGFHMAKGTLRTIVLFSPMVPVLLMVIAVVRYFRRVDEYMRLIILENWAITACITALWTFAYGFLENAGFPLLSMFTVFPMMGFTSAFLFLVRRLAGR